MILRQTTEIEDVHRIMFNDEIWAKVKIDGADRCRPVKSFPKNKIALKVLVSDEIIGIHLFSIDGAKLGYHPMLLKDYRLEHAKEFFDRGIEWAFSNTDCEMLEVEIPCTHKATINMAKKWGFSEIGGGDTVIIDSIEQRRVLLRLNRIAEGKVKIGLQDPNKGFPTANIDYKGRKGVFVCNTNYGKALAVCIKSGELEVHIFDFNKDIYGQTLKVENMKEIDKKLFLGIGLLINEVDI